MLPWFKKTEDLGIFIFRLFLGIRLLYGVMDNVVYSDRMEEFETFLAQHHFPLPLLSALVSVYAQAVAAILIILGWNIRWAAALMFINFVIALVMVHWGQTFEQMTTVLFMIFSTLLLLFTGAGKYAVGKS